MAIALREEGLPVKQQAPVAVYFRGQLVGDFRADLLVSDGVIVELKAARVLHVTQRGHGQDAPFPAPTHS